MRRACILWPSTLLLLAVIACPSHQTYGATVWKTARAHYGGLALELQVRMAGSTLVSKVTLTNTGEEAFRYRGGCAPPLAQIQVNDSGGRHVYGWTPPRVQCGAITFLSLAPGSSVHVRARFRIDESVDVRALVPSMAGTSPLFRTREIEVSPPQS